MRFKILCAVIFLTLFTFIFAQESKSRAEFFKEFYGTFISSSDIEIGTEEEAAADLAEVIKKLEERYNIDIPESEKENFKTAEDVTEYVNRHLGQQAEIKEEKAVAERSPEKGEKPHSWLFKLHGSYGIVEPEGVTGKQGWYGNLGKIKRDEGLDLFGDAGTWEIGFALHPYGWNGKEGKSGNSWGLTFDHAKFDQWGPDSVFAGFENDTTNASRYAVSLNFQQDLTGRKKTRPKAGIYFMESLRLGVHSYRHTNANLWGNNHLSYGIGLAQGIYFYIFDLKFYQNLAFSPDIMKVRPDLSLLNALDMEIGLRLGIALKL